VSPPRSGDGFAAYASKGSKARDLRDPIIEPFYSPMGDARHHLGAFGTGRVSPRSAGKRSSFNASPVVVPTFGGFAVCGANGSAGWCGSAVGGGAASILMPSPSSRGAGAFCAAATPVLKSSAAKTREIIRCVLALASPKQTPRTDPSSRAPSLEGVALWPRFFDGKMNVQRSACGLRVIFVQGGEARSDRSGAEESCMLTLCLTPDISSLGLRRDRLSAAPAGLPLRGRGGPGKGADPPGPPARPKHGGCWCLEARPSIRARHI
jgi:hypothetical protein